MAFTVYVATLGELPSWDALRFAAALAAGRWDWATSAHHPLGGLVAHALYRAAHALGWKIEALPALQLTSALGAAVAVGGVHAVLRAAGAPAVTALATAAALAVSLAFWDVATDGEVYAVAAAALVTAWGMLLRVARGGVATAVGAGVASGVAVLGHQLNAVVLLCSPLAFRHAHRPGRGWSVYAAAAAVTVIAGYTCAWMLSGWSQTARGFVSWATHYLRVGLHFPSDDPLAGAVRGLLASLVPLSGGLAAIAAAAVIAAVVSVGAIALRAGWQGHAAPLAPAAGLAALIAAVLVVWWEPDTRKFWTPTLVCGWLAMGLALAREPAARGGVLSFTAAAMALLNLAVVVLPRAAADNPYREAARRIAAATEADDLIVVGTDALGPSVAYYAGRPHVTNVFAIFFEAAARGSDGGEALRRLIAVARARGGRVFMSSDALAISPARRALAPGIAATPEELLPDEQRVPALRYPVGGVQRLLVELHAPPPPPAG